MKMLAPLGLIVSYAALGGMPEADLFRGMAPPKSAAAPAVRVIGTHVFRQAPSTLRETACKKVSGVVGRGKDQAGHYRSVPAAGRSAGASPDGVARVPRKNLARAMKLDISFEHQHVVVFRRKPRASNFRQSPRPSGDRGARVTVASRKVENVDAATNALARRRR